MNSAMKNLQGTGASSGVVLAPVVVIETEELVVPEVDDPGAALGQAVEAVAAHLRKLSSEADERGRTDAAEILTAQAFIAEDPMVIDSVSQELANGLGFDEALTKASNDMSELLASLPDPYLAARAADVGEVTERIRRHLAGAGQDGGLDLDGPSILCAEQLTAAETATLDPELVVGFATTLGGPTSHVAIIARALGVPAVVGVPDLVATARTGWLGIIDGSTGEVVFEPDDETRARFEQRAEREAEARRLADKLKGQAVSFAGSTIDVSANVAGPDDVERAVEQQADGVGLMRTEFLFLDRPDPPTEEEQLDAYVHALSAFDHTVVIRTFDIGGDKPAEFLNIETEENPFLGVRGVRLYDRFPDLFRSQLRALLRASVHGRLAVMIPMIATGAEFVRVRTEFDRVREELTSDSVPIGDVELGVMIEVPSAALIADVLAPMVDFFSIGTNDLTQYTLAADRVNVDLENLQDPLHPAVLSLCRTTVEAGQRHGRSVSVCGLAAEDPAAAALFVEMGVTKLSVSAPSVNPIKSAVSQLDPERIRHLAATVSELSEAADVRDLLAEDVGPR